MVSFIIIATFSEMEFLGVKIKKAVDSANKEIKEEVKELSTQVTEMKLTNNIQINNSPLASSEKLEELLEVIFSTQQNEGKLAKDIKNELPKDKSVYLLKVLQNIEKVVFELVEKAGYETKAPLTIGRTIWWLAKSKILDGATADILTEIVRISNRGIHNEIISDEYIEFVQKAYPDVMVKLKECLNDVFYSKES